MKILSSVQMKAAEKFAAECGISPLRLMENAGTAAIRFIRERIDVSGVQFTVVCGSGNNGGDGFVAARKLIENGARVSVILAFGTPISMDASEMLERLKNMSPKIIDYSFQRQDSINALSGCGYIVDALFGTGLSGVAAGNAEELIRAVNAAGKIVFALDMPSGANADTGEVAGSCVLADYTIAFAAPKT
ncbi:MAG: NAD(P)H-hydrate epimerase, partial [Clostridia bacterium]|nr:NAD(P)H-hydrate epimerase [Clostridia bacterium]